MALDIRPADRNDIAALCTLDSYADADPKRSGAIAAWVAAGEAHVALLDGQPAGYAALGHHFFGHGLVEMLMVGAPFQRRGVGAALLLHLERFCRTDLVWCSANRSNAAMARLLPKLGYIASGTIEGLDKGDPELFWRKVLARR